jgi:cytoskeletal protein CcmA (bactofilin family)
MFNKPGAFGRNDPITRRDAQPVPGSGSPSALTSSDKSVNAAKEATGNPAVTQSTSTTTAANTPVSATIAATRESSANDNVMGARLIVGPDVKLKGAEILDCDTLVVEGRVEATMDSRVIRIAEKGSFAGKVSIDIAEILGTFEGELTARSQLIIHSTGRVNGTIRYGKLVIDEGGELCGDINVISEKVASQARPVIEPFVALSAATG